MTFYGSLIKHQFFVISLFVSFLISGNLVFASNEIALDANPEIMTEIKSPTATIQDSTFTSENSAQKSAASLIAYKDEPVPPKKKPKKRAGNTSIAPVMTAISGILFGATSVAYLSIDDECGAFDLFKSEAECREEAEDTRSSLLPWMAFSGLGFFTSLAISFSENPKLDQEPKPMPAMASETPLSNNPINDSIPKDSLSIEMGFTEKKGILSSPKTYDNKPSFMTSQPPPPQSQPKKQRTPEEKAKHEKTVKIANKISLASALVLASSFTMSQMVDTSCEDAGSQEIRIECEDRANEKYQGWFILSLVSGMVFITSSLVALVD